MRELPSFDDIMAQRRAAYQQPIVRGKANNPFSVPAGTPITLGEDGNPVATLPNGEPIETLTGFNPEGLNNRYDTIGTEPLQPMDFRTTPPPGQPTFEQSFGTPASPYTDLFAPPTPVVPTPAPIADLFSTTAAGTPTTAVSARPATVPGGYRNIGAVSSGEVPAAIANVVGGIPPSGAAHHIPTSKGGGTVYHRNSSPGFLKTDGFKNEVTNNPGNIWAAGNKLLYGATGRLVSDYNGEDQADSNLLVYPSAKAGFAAMNVQMSRPLYHGPIKTAFAKWQKKGFKHKLAGLKKAGIDINKSYNQLSASDQKAMRKVWAKAEGWRKKEFY